MKTCNYADLSAIIILTKSKYCKQIFILGEDTTAILKKIEIKLCIKMIFSLSSYNHSSNLLQDVHEYLILGLYGLGQCRGEFIFSSILKKHL